MREFRVVLFTQEAVLSHALLNGCIWAAVVLVVSMAIGLHRSVGRPLLWALLLASIAGLARGGYEFVAREVVRYPIASTAQREWSPPERAIHA